MSASLLNWDLFLKNISFAAWELAPFGFDTVQLAWRWVMPVVLLDSAFQPVEYLYLSGPLSDSLVHWVPLHARFHHLSHLKLLASISNWRMAPVLQMFWRTGEAEGTAVNPLNALSGMLFGLHTIPQHRWQDYTVDHSRSELSVHPSFNRCVHCHWRLGGSRDYFCP